MQLRNILKNSINAILAPLGYSIINADYNKSMSMQGAMEAIAKRNHLVTTVIDIGASNGQWSSMLMDYFPSSNYLLIEAQPVHEKELKNFCEKYKNADYVLAAAGEKEGQIYFNTNDPFGGQASTEPYPSNNTVVPVTTIDKQIADRKLEGPYLLKLDTHGYEIPILKGAANTIMQSEVIVIECYNYKIATECLLFYDMCIYLEEKNFRCIDMVDVMHRPHDKSLWQMDLVFIKKNREDFVYQGYE